MGARIEDYALIGDLETAALVSRGGSIDWLCVPRFDSGACFAALLGGPKHGRFLLAPTAAARSTRGYRGRTLVLETTHATGDGEVVVVDAMPPRRAGGPDVVRVVEGRRGTVRMRCELVIRFDYGSIIPWVRRTATGLVAVAGPDRLRVVTPVALRGHGMTTVAEFDVRAGERIPFVLSWSASHDEPVLPPDPFAAIDDTLGFWEAWAGRARVAGPYADAVLRSLVALKALIYVPTGGIVAAPTTSLPERLGGARNWDYRYCWLRDSTFTLYALLQAGYTAEAAAWRDWLIRAVAGRPDQTQILYGLAGERRATEIELDWLPGYEGSRPVRIGNDASRQLQLDVYGEVLDTMHLWRRLGGVTGDDAWRVELALADFVCERWREPDQGIWEVRGPQRHFTSSKVMAWVALDRAIRAVETFGLSGPVDRWRAARDEVHADVLAHGIDPRRGCFVQSYGATEIDASTLLVPQVGFLPAQDPRVLATIEAVERELVRDGLVLRYRSDRTDDGLPAGEGVFLACSFWLVDAYVLAGRLDDARALFERLLACRNDVGLLAEQIDPRSGRHLGNFPQALSHIALVNSARNLADAAGPAHHRRDRA